MTMQEIIELLESGAYGCGCAASESWGSAVGALELDAACLRELAQDLAPGAHLWIELPDETFTRITTDA